MFSKVVINSPDDLGKLLNEQQPKLSKNLNLQVSDRVAVSDSISISKNGVEYIDIPGFGMVERPSDTEIELVKKARGDKPYNAIWDVKLGKDEQGNITSLQWSEN